MTFETKDSGKRVQFATGMQRDTSEDKPRFDLITPQALPYNATMRYRRAMLMARGAVKYTSRNWESAATQEELDRFMESAERHFEQWKAGETDEDHAAAVQFNMDGAEYVKWRLASNAPPVFTSTEWDNAAESVKGGRLPEDWVRRLRHG